MKAPAKKLPSQYVIHLRDDIAIAALEKLLEADIPAVAADLAATAYRIADAMILERNKK